MHFYIAGKNKLTLFMSHMNRSSRLLLPPSWPVLASLLSPTLSSADLVLFPNGDFESGSASWVEASGAGTFSFAYPEAGGNPDGHAVIDHSAADGGFGILIADANAIMSLDSLGMTPGRVYRFVQDMIIESGSRIGGLKVEFYKDGAPVAGTPTTGDIYPEAINGGANWATYEFLVSIPDQTNGIKIVPLWGPGARVGFDNIGFDSEPLPLEVIENPGFDLGNLSWFQEGSIESSWAYRESGGNPDGYGVIANTGIGFGSWIANNNSIIPLSDLELAPGETAIFQQDMIILDGPTPGGLKIDFFRGPDFVSSTGKMTPERIGDGSTWETYRFPVDIPEGVDGIKLVPREGLGSTVGFDNFDWSRVPPLASANPEGSYLEGAIVSWTPTKPEKTYQPQKSVDGVLWTSFGPAYPGTGTTSLLDPDPVDFYRIAEIDPPAFNLLPNGDFELITLIDSGCPDGWACLTNTNQNPTRTTSDSFSGEASMRMFVVNDFSGAPNQGVLEYNQASAGGFVVPGQNYRFSFRAKQISAGPSYVQFYRLQWFNGLGEPIPGTAIGFKPFTGGDDTWAEISEPEIVAPPGAASVFVEILGTTGAVAGSDARGEVLIDAVSLTEGGSAEPNYLETTREEGSGIYLQTRPGQAYRAQVTSDLVTFENLSGIFIGNGKPVGAGTPISGARKFFRFEELSPEPR